MRRILKNVLLVLYYILQLIIFGLCFLVFTSTIKFFPWYEPLTMGPFIGLMLVIPVQVLISLISWILHKYSLIHNDSNVISIFNLSILLLFTIVITQSKETLFYPLAIICAIAECLLALLFLLSIILPLVRRKNSQESS